MAVINKNDKQVKKALAHESLIGKTLLGKGVFSLVFEDTDDTVLKLTADGKHVELLKEVAGLDESCRAYFPEIVEDMGVIGELIKGDNRAPLHLLRISKLEHAKTGSEQRKLISKLCKDQLNAYANNIRHHCFGELAHKTLHDVAAQPVFDSLRKPLLLIADFAKRMKDEVSLDLHSKNIMVDRSGRIVFSDPLSDVSTRHIFN